MRVNNWLSGFACVLLLGVVGCKKDKIREGIPVVVEKVGVDDVEIFGDYVGRIRARQFVEVHARVEGYLEKMLFEEGKRVERNQPLFIINPDLYKARADKAAAQLKKDEAQELKTGRDVERLRPLYEQNAASQLDLDNAIAAYESAKANVAMSKADLAQAEMELGYTTVRSPISGYISERHADIGTLVGPGSKSLLATVVASDTVLVDFSLTALDYLRSQQRNVRLGEQDATRSWQPSKFTDGFTGDRSRLITGKIRLERFQVTGQIIHPSQVGGNPDTAFPVFEDIENRLITQTFRIRRIVHS